MSNSFILTFLLGALFSFTITKLMQALDAQNHARRIADNLREHLEELLSDVADKEGRAKTRALWNDIYNITRNIFKDSPVELQRCASEMIKNTYDEIRYIRGNMEFYLTEEDEKKCDAIVNAFLNNQVNDLVFGYNAERRASPPPKTLGKRQSVGV